MGIASMSGAFGMMNVQVNGKFGTPTHYDSTTDTGYYGIKTSAQIMSGTQLATAMGITEGTSQNNTDGWLHFYVGKNATCNKTGKAYEIYVAKKAIRHSISWNHINSKNGVTGKDVIANNGITYKCRLLTGADANPSTTTDGMGSEWNNLIYRVHSEVVNTGTNKQIGANWATMDNNELNITGNGGYTWCQEVYGPSPTNRVGRGY